MQRCCQKASPTAVLSGKLNLRQNTFRTSSRPFAHHSWHLFRPQSVRLVRRFRPCQSKPERPEEDEAYLRLSRKGEDTSDFSFWERVVEFPLLPLSEWLLEEGLNLLPPPFMANPEKNAGTDSDAQARTGQEEHIIGASLPPLLSTRQLRFFAGAALLTCTDMHLHICTVRLYTMSWQWVPTTRLHTLSWQCMPRFLLRSTVLVNGLWGNKENWAVVVENLKEQLDARTSLIMPSNANSYLEVSWAQHQQARHKSTNWQPGTLGGAPWQCFGAGFTRPSTSRH
jgi:hypothetical protein